MTSFLSFFAAPPLEPLSLPLLLYLLLFFRFEMDPPLYPPLVGVVLLLVLVCYGSGRVGSEEYTSVLTPKIADMLVTSFFMRYFASLNFLKFSVDTLFWGKFRPKLPSPTSLLSLYFLLFHIISLLLLYFFVHILSSLPTKSGSDPVSEEDNVVVEAVVGFLVPPVLTLPP